MDPVTLAIVSAIAAGAASGGTEVAKKSIVDAYESLKGIIKKKFGAHSEGLQAIEKIETAPESAGRKIVLEEEVKAANMAADPEIASAAQSLLQLIRSLPNGERHIQIVSGVGNAVADHGSTATSNVTGWPGKYQHE